MKITKSVWPLALSTAIFTSAAPLMAETPVGSNIDSRVVVAIAANSTAVNEMLPEGWSSFAFPAGPTKGANFLALFIDSVLEMDPEGAPLTPASRRAVAFAGLAKKDDAVRLFVMNYLTTLPEVDPYGVGSGADISRVKTLSGPANGARESTDIWTINTPDGGEMTLSLDYTTGNRGWTSGELFPHSAVNPDFSRIYRFQQMGDLVVSTALGKPSSGTYAIKSSIAGLADVFDGTEDIITVIDVPVYVRDVLLP